MTVTCSRCRREYRAEEAAERFSGLCPKCVYLSVFGEPTADGIQFGNYRLLGVLGTGGMGIVYKARQRGLERTVALKMLPTSRDTPAELVERFFRETRAAAALQHPNTVPIHEVSSHDGTYCYSMDLVEGQSLSAMMRARGPASRPILGMIRKVAMAVHHAHERGGIHRDLKPSNIMVDRDSQPKILVFGVAQILSTRCATVEGSVLGTPSYMSPEQAAGAADIDARADVYSLGAILYECLAGRPPHTGESAVEVLRKVAAEEPAPLPGVPRELEAICRKALRKEAREEMNRLWIESAADLWNRSFKDRYPFERDMKKKDVTMTDFVKFFAPKKGIFSTLQDYAVVLNRVVIDQQPLLKQSDEFRKAMEVVRTFHALLWHGEDRISVKFTLTVEPPIGDITQILIKMGADPFDLTKRIEGGVTARATLVWHPGDEVFMKIVAGRGADSRQRAPYQQLPGEHWGLFRLLDGLALKEVRPGEYRLSYEYPAGQVLRLRLHCEPATPLSKSFFSAFRFPERLAE